MTESTGMRRASFPWRRPHQTLRFMQGYRVQPNPVMNYYYEFLIKSKIETREITAYILWQIVEMRIACVDCKLCDSFVAVSRSVWQSGADPTVTFASCCRLLLNLQLIHAYI